MMIGENRGADHAFQIRNHSRISRSLTKGLEPKSHEGALRLLAQHFEKDGPLPHGSVNTIAKIMKFREEADYNVAIHFTREDCLGLRQEAAGLASAIRRILDQSAG